MTTSTVSLTRLLILASVLFMSACVEEMVYDQVPADDDLADKATQGSGGSSIGTGGVSTGPQGTGGVTTGGTGSPTGGVTTPTGGVSTGGTTTTGTGGQSSGDCTPGTLVGTCELCGFDGTNTVPERDDQNCPSFDCEEYFSFLLVRLDSGLFDCRVQYSTPKESNCQGLGACNNTIEQYCRLGTDESYFDEPVVSDQCQEVQGCDGLTPPEVVFTPEDTPCETEEGAGSCDGQGACVITEPVEPPPPPLPPSCSDAFDISFNNNNEFCDEVSTPDRLICTYYLDDNNQPFSNRNDNSYSCNEFCIANGATCVDTWNDNTRNHCQVRDTGRNCNDAGLETYVCQCEILPQAQP